MASKLKTGSAARVIQGSVDADWNGPCLAITFTRWPVLMHGRPNTVMHQSQRSQSTGTVCGMIISCGPSCRIEPGASSSDEPGLDEGCDEVGVTNGHRLATATCHCEHVP